MRICRAVHRPISVHLAITGRTHTATKAAPPNRTARR